MAVLLPRLLLAFITIATCAFAKFKRDDDPATVKLIDDVAGVGFDCVSEPLKHKVEENPESGFMKCTETMATSKGVKLPRDMFKAFFVAVDAFVAKSTVTTRSDILDITLPILLGTWKNLVEEALQVLPLRTLTPECQMTTGQGVSTHEEIKTLLAGTTQTPKVTFQALFNTKFQVVPPPGKQPGDQFGSGENKDGVIYLVSEKKGGPTSIFKGVPAGTAPVPLEFKMHEELYNQAFTFKEKAIAKFIPRPIQIGRSTSTKKFDFMIMEHLGPTLYELRDHADANLKLKKEDVGRVLMRSYLILKELHKAGFAHNDGHANNWAVSKTDKTVLELFDFGRSVDMKQTGDWLPAIADLRMWTINVVELVLKKFYEDTTFTDKFGPTFVSLTKHFNEYSWQNPDFPQVTIPFPNFPKLDSKDAFLKAKIVTEVDTIIKPLFNEKNFGGFDSPDAITAWSAANAKPADSRRRRGLDWGMPKNSQAKAAMPSPAVHDQPNCIYKRMDMKHLEETLSAQIKEAKAKQPKVH